MVFAYPDHTVMAIEVNGVRIDQELIRAKAAQLRQEAREAGFDVTPEDGLRFFEEASEITVGEQLVDQEAARLGIEVEQLFDLWCSPIRQPRPKEIRDIYLKHVDQFWTPASILVSHIVKNVNHEDEREPRRREMEQVRELIESGMSFAEAADAHSDCPGEGGTLGYIHEGEMVPEFDEVVFHASVGELTPVFQTRFGFHVALVSDTRPAGTRPYEEVAPRIAQAIVSEQRDEMISRRILELRERATIRQVSSA